METLGYPVLTIDTKKLEHNTQVISELLEQQGIRLVTVAKGTCAHFSVVEAMVAGGAAAICDSRVDNLAKIRKQGYKGETILLRSPGFSECKAAVEYADTSLNSETEIVCRLGQEAVRAGKTHQVVLMIELGDLREGVPLDKASDIAAQMDQVPGIDLVGVGVNFACYGGVIPTRGKMDQLIEVKKQIEERLEKPILRVSGGTSANMNLLLHGEMPSGITELRVGESILLGTEAINREPISGCYQDAFSFWAEVIEVQVKPSKPFGSIGQDAFGNVPQFEDRGIRKRAILAAGRQDIDPEGLLPCKAGLQILGASSDHLICDVQDVKEPVHVGQVFSFNVNYSTLLKASTSSYVTKRVL